MEKNYRLFVRHLPSNVTCEKLQKLFEKYGSVDKVDIKEKSMNDGSKIAFIYMNLKEQQLNNCFRDVNSTPLDGHNVTVELAKESFLDKLKREREEAQAKADSKPGVTKSNYSLEPINIKIPERINKQRTQQTKHESITNYVNEGQFSESLEKDFNHTKRENVHVVADSKKKNSCQSDLKRLASLKQRKQSFHAKEQLIRNALKAVDSKNNKIIFSDNINSFATNASNHQTITSNRQLFEDDDGDDESDNNAITFDINKTYKPKASIDNDSRFLMDERFYDEEEDKINESSEEEEDELVKEKKKELKILEDVLGKPMMKKDDKQVAVKRTNAMIRYDPTKDDHHKHELKIEKPQKCEPKKKRKKEEIAAKNKEENNDNVIPTSNEIFFSVSNNLKESLSNQEEFSLLKSFGHVELPNNKNDNKSDETSPQQRAKIGIYFDTKNPFKYDSSDDEDDTLIEENEFSNKSMTNGVNNSISPYHLGTFFLTSDDPRFKDAGEFFTTRVMSDESFRNIRRELKQIVRTKVRNNIRKCQPWKNRKSKVKRR